MDDADDILENWKTELALNLIIGVFAIGFKDYYVGPITLGAILLLFSVVITLISVYQAIEKSEWIRLLNVISALFFASLILHGA